jgi:F420-dependent oxidoreductase-like protein
VLYAAPVQFGFRTVLEGTTFGALRDLWRCADEIDVYELAWMNDHFLPVLGDRSGPCLESWVTVTALAQATTRLRVGFLVSAMIYRHPAVLAKMAATLDIVSGGRLELGLGAGWAADECTAYGIDLPPLGERFDRFEEGCHVVTSLLTQEVSNFQGRFFRLVNAPCEPKPIQRPHPPIMIGGTGPKRTLRAVARFADHWNYPISPVSVDESVDEWRRLRDVLADHCADIGRDPATITTSVQLGYSSDPNSLADRAAMWREVGADVGILSFDAPCDPDNLATTAAALAALTPDAGTRWQ